MKKWIFLIFIFILLFGVFNFVSAQPKFAEQNLGGQAQENDVEINFFYSETCSHCARESLFIDKLKDKYPDIVIKRFPVSVKYNVDLLQEFYKDYNVSSEFWGLVPATFIQHHFFPKSGAGFTQNNYFIGFDDKTAGDIENCISEICKGNYSGSNFTPAELGEKVKIPFIDEVDMSIFSLPILSVVLGILDGFNVCSLGALILILGLVLALKSRKKILIFGGLFILTTALVYGLLIVLWYQLFSYFIPYLKIMEILIGILALSGGIYFLKQFIKYKKQGPTCEVSAGNKIISKFSSNFQESLNRQGNIFLLIGTVILFAGIITIVEFPCSAAVPVVFAGVLANSGLSAFSYLFYIAFYLVFYMLDEIIVFLVAFFTMKIWLSSNKVIIWITLIEAIILFVLGFYYLFGFGILL